MTWQDPLRSDPLPWLLAPDEPGVRYMERAIEQGVAFLLGVDPATAAYPTGYSDKPSGSWWKFGFPIFYVTDILQMGDPAGLASAEGDELGAFYETHGS